MENIEKLKESHDFIQLCEEIEIRRKLKESMVGDLYPAIVQQEIYELGERVRFILIDQTRKVLIQKFFNDLRNYLRENNPNDPNVLQIEEVSLKNSYLYIFSGNAAEKEKNINAFVLFIEPIVKHYQKYNVSKIYKHCGDIFIFEREII